MENQTCPKLIWKHDLPNSGGASSPTLGDGKIFVAYSTYEPNDNYLICLSANDGASLWNIDVGGATFAHPTPSYSNGKVYGGTSGIVNCYNAESGNLLWNTEVGREEIQSSMPIANGKLYVGTLEYKGPNY